MVKKHWPILFAMLIVIICIIFMVIASKSTDTGVGIVVAVAIFMYLLPLAGAVNGGWYGWRLRSPLKWLLAPAVYLCVCLYLIIEDLALSGGSIDLGTDMSIGLITGIACLVVEVITSIIAWAVRKNKAGKNKVDEHKVAVNEAAANEAGEEHDQTL